jgi:GlcNAc-P-P-Und epimerase
MLVHRVLVTGGSGFIGTHLVEKLIRHNVPVLSIDVRPPKLSHHQDFWMSCNIMSIERVDAIFTQFKPTHVYHLAARANLKGQSIEDFPENTIGTDNVIKCVNISRSIERFIHFSTQYVVRPGVWPETEDFFLPYTPYGVSKAEAEKIVRNNCNKCWIVLRPTNVWGPYHPFFPYELWKYLRLKLYLHPGYEPIIKHYSFVTNAADQIVAITMAKTESVCGKVFYITDPPIDNAEWMNAFSVALTGKQVRRIPKNFWKFLAKSGDAMNRLGVKFPMSSERFFRLTVNEQVPYEATIELAGPPRVSLGEGINKSANWYLKLIKGN